MSLFLTVCQASLSSLYEGVRDVNQIHFEPPLSDDLRR